MARKLTIEEIKQRIKDRFPNESFDIVEYTNLGAKGVFKCNTCGKEIVVNKASNFFAPSKAYGCVNCHGLWKQKEADLKIIKEKYDILDTFVKNSHTQYHIRCKKCGHERTTDRQNIMRHLECGCKTGVIRNRTSEEFLAEVNKNSTLGEYELVSEYINQTEKVLMKHIPCGFIWSVRPNDIITGKTGCPKCRKTVSKGESMVENILIGLGIIDFEKEKYIQLTKQRFDFYFVFNNKQFAIEFNGVQHYEEVPYFTSTLAIVQERDKRKAQYCKDHNIELIIIPYTMSENEAKQYISNRLNDYPGREQG